MIGRSVGRNGGRYLLEAVLGEGGLGTAFKAAPLALMEGQPVSEKAPSSVVLKLVRKEPSSDTDFRNALLAGPRRLEGLRHASIVPWLDTLLDQEDIFLLEEYVDAPSLSQLMAREGPLPVEVVAALGLQLLSALAVAHAQGHVHQDIRPSHILVGLTIARLRGHGSCAAWYANPRLRRTLLPGTAGYLPPERWYGKAASPPGDIYALGLCLYEALLGKPLAPLESGDRDCYFFHTTAEIKDPREALPQVPSWMAEALHRATRRRPEDRFPDARAMLQVFRQRRPLEPVADPAPARPIEAPSLEEARTVALPPSKHEVTPRRTARAWTPPSSSEAGSNGTIPAGTGEASPPRPELPPQGLAAVQAGTDWKPGEHTLAFVRDAQKPWKTLALALGLIGGLLVVASLVLLPRLTSLLTPPALFQISLTNVKQEPVRVACSAGEGAARHDWALTLPAGRETSVGIPALPASCFEVTSDGRLDLLWSTPKELLAASDEPLEAPEETWLLLPEPPSQDGVSPVKPPSAVPPPSPRSKDEPVAARILVGTSEAVSTAAPDCEDLQALETWAQKGELPPPLLSCLEKGIQSAEAITLKDKRSRLLLWNAEARKDMVEWERLVKRHIQRIDRSDTDICYAYALFLKKRGNNEDLKESIVQVGYAMESVQRKYSGDAYIRRMTSLHALRTNAASSMWTRAEKAFQAQRNPQAQQLAEEWRTAAKAFAREWYDYAVAAGSEVDRARRLCQSVSGTTTMCP